MFVLCSPGKHVTWKSRNFVFFTAAALLADARVAPPPFDGWPESSPEPNGITVPPLPVPRLRNDSGLWCAVLLEYEKADTSMGFAGRVSCPPGRSCSFISPKSVEHAQSPVTEVSPEVLWLRAMKQQWCTEWRRTHEEPYAIEITRLSCWVHRTFVCHTNRGCSVGFVWAKTIRLSDTLLTQ